MTWTGRAAWMLTNAVTCGLPRIVQQSCDNNRASTRILRTSSYLGTKFSRSILARNGDSIGYLYCSGGISNDEPKHIWKEYFQVALSIKPTEPAAVAAEGAADYRPSIRVQANLSNLNLHKWHKSKRKALFFANIPKKKPNKFLPVAFTVNH